MRQFTLLALLLLSGLALAQDDPAADGAEEGAEEGDGAEEECEEAWEYVDFMKASVKDKVEEILQDTLFQPRPLLEETVTKTMEKVLEIRDDILARTKAIRTGEGEITICPEQNIKQEEFLTQIRMSVMEVLFSLIDEGAATHDSLQNIGKQLLSIRTKVNSEITRMIMLRQSSGAVRVRKDDCDCGILGEVFDGLEAIIKDGEDKADDEEAAGDDAAEEGAEDEAEVAEAKAGEEAAGNKVAELTMISMTVDGEIKNLYSEILGELDDEARGKLFKELTKLKEISTEVHNVLSKLSELDGEHDMEQITRIKRRDIRSIRNDVKHELDICKQSCPGQCDSCGAEKIDEVSDKLKDYLANLEDLEEQEALESIRTDVMNYLTQTNGDMTELLKQKAQEGELDECGSEQLVVIEKIKGPLWMMVNITIFGDKDTMAEMIAALEEVLTELRNQYCSPTDTEPEPKIEDDECDLEEINGARDWIADIDLVISEDILKSGEEDSRREAMLALIELKSTMEDRVRVLFQNGLQCNEEVQHIKNVYVPKLTMCLAEMMNPRIPFDLLDRADRVKCVKELRTEIEDRRGVLLMREIENRIKESGVETADDEES